MFSDKNSQVENIANEKIELTVKFILSIFESFEKIQAKVIEEKNNILNFCTFIMKHNINYISNNQHISKLCL